MMVYGIYIYIYMAPTAADSKMLEDGFRMIYAGSSFCRLWGWRTVVFQLSTSSVCGSIPPPQGKIQDVNMKVEG